MAPPVKGPPLPPPGLQEVPAQGLSTMYVAKSHPPLPSPAASPPSLTPSRAVPRSNSSKVEVFNMATEIMSANSISEHGDPAKTSDPLIALLQGQQDMFKTTLAPRPESVRYNMKVPALSSFPVVSPAHLENVEEYLREFERVSRHVTGGKTLPREEAITHLLQCWPKDSVVGDALRVAQRDQAYFAAEVAGNFAECWELLIAELEDHGKSRAVSRRDAQQAWKALKMNPGEHVREFHKAFQEFPADYELAMQYMDTISPAIAKYIERHGVCATLLEAQSSAKEWQDVEDAYTDQAGNMSGRQRAVWDSSRKQLGTPLGNLSDGGMPRGNGEPRTCKTCTGVGHHSDRCPNKVSAKDPKWTTEQDKAKHKCGDCGGIGHFARHHGVQQNAFNVAPGACPFGDECRFQHDEAKKNKGVPAPLTNRQTQESTDTGDDDQALLVLSGVRERPVRIDRTSVPVGNVQLVKFSALKLPAVDRPGTTISEIAASRVLRAQATLPLGERVAFVDMGRYAVPQKFYGFANSDCKTVDVQAYIRLKVPDRGSSVGADIPEFMIRVVPGQHGDILVSSPTLDMLRWTRENDHYTVDGKVIPRDQPAPKNVVYRRTRVHESEADDDGVVQLRLRESLLLPPFSAAQVLVEADVKCAGSDETRWFAPDSALLAAGLQIPEGPMHAHSYQSMIVSNRSDVQLEMCAGKVVGEMHVMEHRSEEAELSQALEHLSEELPSEELPAPVVAKRPVPQTSSVGMVRSGSSSSSMTLARWVTVVLALLSLPLREAIVFQQASGVSAPSSCEAEWLYPDLMSDEYQNAVVAEFDVQEQDGRYSHLAKKQLSSMRKFVISNANSFYIHGAKPTTISKYEFDMELHPGAKPHKATLPRYSPEQAKKEQHHLRKAIEMRHLVDAVNVGPWAMATHVVFKKDSERGRLICDFLILNKSTVTMPISIGDVRDKSRAMSTFVWKSLFDAVHGFNQVRASAAVQKLLTILTSLGLKQWAVMPFGVCNGPATYQGIMQSIFADYLGDSEQIKDLDSMVDFFMDDGACGTGSSPGVAVGCDVAFDKHLKCLGLVFARAREHDLRPTRREDVERLLATVSFLRQRLNPHYSDLTKPLRDVLVELHTKRSQGYKSRKQFKGSSTPAAEQSDDPAPERWTPEADKAFQTVKQMVARAVALSSPDIEGALNGTNPFRLYVDACSYGIGGGLFQAPADTVDEVGTHYKTLGVASWSTKTDVERAYNKGKKLLASRTSSPAQVESLDEAYTVLSNVEGRKQYDEALGLAAGRLKNRLQLQPLGFFSRSLNSAQRNWTTWERELLAVLEGAMTFNSIAGGSELRIHIDRLNNTVIADDLKSPDKILGMLLRIESLVRPKWEFQPGRTNVVGDGFSRNPPDLDEVRVEFESRSALPKTLQEAFEMAANSRASVDDADWVINARILQEDDKPPAWYEACVVAEFDLATGFAGTLPQVRSDGLGPSSLLLSVAVVMDLIISCPMGSRRWLELYAPLPMPKKDRRRHRLSAFDAVLALLRAIRDCSFTAVVSHGEGALVNALFLSADVRAAAYKERHVAAEEQSVLEECLGSVSHSVLLAPQGFPSKSAYTNLRDLVPEMNVIAPPADMSVTVVVPLRDATRDVSVMICKLILGAERVDFGFPGPAFRTLPNGLKLHTLCRAKIVAAPANYHAEPKTFVEAMAGAAVLTAEVARVGFTCRAYERDVGVYHAEGDLSNPEVMNGLRTMIKRKQIFQIHTAPHCRSFGQLQNLNPNSTRSALVPEGSTPSEIEANQGLAGEIRSKASSPYCRGLAAPYARMVKASYDAKVTVQPITLRSVPTLEQLLVDIAWSPEVIEQVVVQAAIKSKGPVIAPKPSQASSDSSSSAAPLPAPAQALAPVELDEAPATEDYWAVMGNMLDRYHVQPRQRMFSPADHPEVDTFADRRWTTVVFEKNKKSTVVKDIWTDPATVTRALSAPWTGRAIFRRKPGLTPIEDPVDLAIPVVGEPVGPDNLAVNLTVRSKAADYRLASDGVLLIKTEDELRELIVIPDVVYAGPSKHADAPKRMTWKHLLLASVHNTATGAHKGSQEMYEELSDIVAWFPASGMRSDCQKWVDRCRHCVGVHRRPIGQPPPKPVLEFRPFYRIQIDLIGIRPKGEDGETHILTAVCVAPRYPFFRNIVGRESATVAETLLDSILDMGLVPATIQSDLEFMNIVLEELVSMMGGSQLFSTALRPQSQGIDERSHKDIRAGFAILIESLSRAAPRRWPKYTRWMESKLRQKHLIHGKDATPFSVIHGFSGSSSLRSALSCLSEIPDELVRNDWSQAIVQESKYLTSVTAEDFKMSAEVASSASAAANRRFVNVEAGELLLVQKPFYEKGQGMVLPQNDGPFVVDLVYNDHAVRLRDVLSGDPVFNGRRVATSRLVRFPFPPEWTQHDLREDVDAHVTFKVALGDRFGPWTLELLAAAGVPLHIAKSKSRSSVIGRLPKLGPVLRMLWEESLALLDFRSRTHRPDVGLCNAAMLACGREAGQWQIVLQLLKGVWQMDMKPDMLSYNVAMGACSQAGQWQKVLCLLNEMQKFRRRDIFTFNVSMQAYAQGRLWEESLAMLAEMLYYDVHPTWQMYNLGIIMAGEGKQWETALDLVDDMWKREVIPDAVTYSA
ncbi:unnamed protein product, partial [Polarella glacialis]